MSGFDCSDCSQETEESICSYWLKGSNYDVMNRKERPSEYIDDTDSEMTQLKQKLANLPKQVPKTKKKKIIK